MFADIKNIRTGWYHAITESDTTSLGLYVDGLYEFYAFIGLYQEGKEAFAVANKVKALAGEPMLQAKLCAKQAEMCLELGEVETAVALLNLQEVQTKLSTAAIVLLQENRADIQLESFLQTLQTAVLPGKSVSRK